MRLEHLEDRTLLDAAVRQLLVTYTSGLVGVVTLEPGANMKQSVAALKARRDIRHVEVNQRVTITSIPDDTRFREQWAYQNNGSGGGRIDADIDAPEAWDYHTGGTSKIIAVIDTGIDYTHRDLYKNIWINQGEIPTEIRDRLRDVDADGLITFWDLNDSRNIGPETITDLNATGYIDAGDILKPSSQGGWANGVSEDGDTAHVDDLIGWNFLTNTNDPFDDNGHGTHVSGIIGGLGNNTLGVTGVNWRTQIAGLKFMSDDGSGGLDGAVAAMQYAVAHGIPVTNNSWGGGDYSQTLYDAMADAEAAGQLVVVAAGNSGANVDATPSYPASYGLSNIVAVAATDRRDNLAAFSNYGATTIDIGAPGQDILSTTPGNNYALNSGTSAATPFVAGAAAFVWSQNPSWTYSQVIRAILDNADRVTSLTNKVATGARLNLYESIDDDDTPSPDTNGARVVSANVHETTRISRLRVTFNKPIDPSSFTADDLVLTGPSGERIAIPQVQSVGGNNLTFEVTFAPLLTSGNYSFTIGPDVRDVAGNAMDQNTNGINGEAEDVYSDTFTVENPPPAPQPRPGAKIISVVTNRPTSVSSLRITFDKDVTPGSFSAEDVRLTGPGGAPLVITGVQAVTGSGNTIFDLSFAPQTTAGSYIVHIGPDILDTATPGNKMDQNGNGINGESTDFYAGTFSVIGSPRQIFSSTQRKPIRDMQMIASTINVPSNIVVGNLDVKLNITHSYDGNLTIYLRAPNGRMITLVANRGGSGNNFTNTYLDDEATRSIASGQAPFTGTYRPESALAAFKGLNAKGVWTLFVYDKVKGNVGAIESWTLSIEPTQVSSGGSYRTFSVSSEVPVVPVRPTMPPSGLATSALTSLATWLLAKPTVPLEETPSPRVETPTTLPGDVVSELGKKAKRSRGEFAQDEWNAVE